MLVLKVLNATRLGLGRHPRTSGVGGSKFHTLGLGLTSSVLQFVGSKCHTLGVGGDVPGLEIYMIHLGSALKVLSFTRWGLG